MVTLSEDSRRRVARTLAHTGWWGALGVLAVHISMGGAPPTGHAPPWLGLIVVLLIGIGIAAGQTLGRMRLTLAIKTAFKTGYVQGDRDQMDDVRDRQNQILTELESAREDRNHLVKQLQQEIREQTKL